MVENAEVAQMGTALVPSERRSRKRSEQIARQIVDYILSNGLSAGTTLPVESELAETLGVGRSTVREALLLLETWGVITIKAGRNGGPVVRRLGRDGLREALALQLQFASATLRDIIEARLAVEPMAARLAATRMRAADIRLLDASTERMRASGDARTAFAAEGRCFHSLIAEHTRSVVLHSVIDTIKMISDGAVADLRYTSARRESVVAAHEQITAAIRDGDADRAEKEMRRHIDDQGKYYRKQGVIDRLLDWHSRD